MAQRIHIIIAEPSAIIRSGITALLQRIPNFSIDTAEVSDVAALPLGSARMVPDLLIINPAYTGQLTLGQLRAELGNNSLKIIALQTSFVDQSILQGYDEVISLYDSSESIANKITTIIHNDEDDEFATKKELSIREKEIIVCVVKGMTNKLIADTLNISTHTVIAHRRNIANKLQIHSPSGLTIYAIVNKLVDLSDIKNYCCPLK